MTLDSKQVIPLLQAALFGRTILLDAAQAYGCRMRDAGLQSDAPMQLDCIGGNADIGTPDMAETQDFGHHMLGRVRRDRECDALRTLNDGGVDADHLASR